MEQQSIPHEIPTELINGVAYVDRGKGEMIALTAVKPEHIEEDALVRRLAARAVEVNAILAALKAEIFSEVAAYRDLLAEKYGVKRRGSKGNITLQTVDSGIRLTVAIGESITFGAELEVAKELIDDCIRRWAQGSSNNIRALVDQAFQVDKTGKLNTDRILGLRRLQIEDDTGDWEKAMNIISDSMRRQFSKEYARFYRVDRQTGEDKPIKLDLANA